MGYGKKAANFVNESFKNADKIKVPGTGRTVGSYVSRKERNTITEDEYNARIKKNKR